MSRLIIKNLPKKIKEERIRSIFAGQGELTDVKLCYTKDGKFRRFGFIGYKTEEQAKVALHYFDDSFIDTSKIKVDIAKDLGDKSIPRPWSKYSERSSAYERRKKKDEDRNARMKETERCSEKDGLDTHKSAVANVKNKSIKALADLEYDVEFQEFLNVHKHRRSKQTWCNDNSENIIEAEKERKPIGTGKKTKREKIHKGELSTAVCCDDSDESGNEDEVYDASEILGQKDKEVDTKNDKDQEVVAKDCSLSDMAYLKTKIVSGLQMFNVHRTSNKSHNVDIGLNEQETKKEQSSGESENSFSDDDNDDDDDDDNDDDDNDDDNDDDDNNDDNNDDDDDNYGDGDNDDDDDGGGNNKNKSVDLEIDEDGLGHEKAEESSVNGTVKMRGLPFKAKEQDIRDFFAPLRVVNIRMINNVKGKPTGCAFVDFSSKTDLKAALKRDHDCVEGRYIELFKDEGETMPQRDVRDKPWVKRLAAQGNDEQFESIAESGRLFLRNLAYTCSEEDLQQLFERFGPLSETYLPLDKATNKPIGLGFVTFLMPEHAVKAFNQLDGKVFQGRLLHILPSKAKEAKNEVKDTTCTQYKAKRDMKRKNLSSSNHNWNTLFLGMNAVADVMANRYNTTKGDILDDASPSSLAVRMALGETQVVTETRKFLESQGVKLDVFGQPSAKRSKTIMVVKNLPYNTSSEELRTLFAPFGTLGRIILPPAGITALVEFFEQSEAKRAFQKLAYSKFKHVPLYLEWAPVAVLSGNPQDNTTHRTETADNTKQVKSEETVKGNETTDQGEENSNSEDCEGTTVFVKNLNFSTSEIALKEVFSKVGPILSVTIAKKKDPSQPGNLLSMGYGFVEFKKRTDALQTIKVLQNSLLEGHTLQLKMSHRKPSENVSRRKSASLKIQKSSKILVRNVPFEATKKELQELFSTFGEIKTLRIPQKMSGTSPHRGFAFVDFLTKQDAKRAFESLCSSTHLYGRRLVLEWAEDEDSVDALRKRTADHFHGTPKAAKKKKDLQDDLMDTEMFE